MKQSLFERYGGFAHVSRVVTHFYDKILDSPLTSPYFEGIDMRRLIDHQTKFIAYIMGGPASYTNDHIERVHAHLGITPAAFNEAVDLLRETLEDMDYEEEDIQTMVDELVSRKHYVISRVGA
jgi:hemoglobin